MKQEPSRFEIFLTRLAFIFYGKSVYQSFANRLPLAGNEQVLDFGCGMGTVAYYTAKRLKSGHLTCVDISSRWLKICRKTLRRHTNVTIAQADVHSLTENSLNMIYCHFVLHDISEDELKIIIPSLVKVLKSGGVLIFREPLKDVNKLTLIKQILTQNKLLHNESRVIDIPLIGSSIESVYIK
jgi:ubiquinone/menaquinone biosynthesis C-methylase UbiE